jgi:hypothetical protein
VSKSTTKRVLVECNNCGEPIDKTREFELEKQRNEAGRAAHEAKIAEAHAWTERAKMREQRDEALARAHKEKLEDRALLMDTYHRATQAEAALERIANDDPSFVEGSANAAARYRREARAALQSERESLRPGVRMADSGRIKRVTLCVKCWEVITPDDEGACACPFRRQEPQTKTFIPESDHYSEIEALRTAIRTELVQEQGRVARIEANAAASLTRGKRE